VIFIFMLGVTLAAEGQRRALRRQVELPRRRRRGSRASCQRPGASSSASCPGRPTCWSASAASACTSCWSGREVGGDLYDFYRLDADRLVFLLGDVSGKGLPGSLFMAVSKSLYKSTALRRGAAVAAMMQEANTEISRDNPEALFVTMFAAVLDVNTGVLEYCNAGHDRPYVLALAGGRPGQLVEGGGRRSAWSTTSGTQPPPGNCGPARRSAC
jgi:serine phosphatase RsbU (regulator of sigma subunit)